MKNILPAIIILLLVSSNRSWSQQAPKNGKHLVKFSIGVNWNPLVESDKSHEKPLGAVFLEKGMPRSFLGKSLGMEWEWRFLEKWSLQTGLFIEARSVNFDNYKVQNIETWNGGVIVTEMDSESGFGPRIISDEVGNTAINNFTYRLPLAVRYYLLNKRRLFLEGGIQLQKITSRNMVQDFTKTTYYIERQEVDLITGQVGTALYLADPPIVTEETSDFELSPSPLQLAALGGLGTSFFLSSQLQLEAKMQYQYLFQPRYFFYHWSQRHQIGITLSLAFST